MTFEQYLKKIKIKKKEIHQADIRKKVFKTSGNTKGKGPEAAEPLVCLENNKKAGEARTE